MSNTKKTPSVRAVTFLLVGVMSIPLLTQIFIDGTGVHTAELVSLFEADIDDIRARAREDHSRFRIQRRAYSRAVERCRDRLRAGENVECPEFNDVSSYTDEPVHQVAPTVEEATENSVPVSDVRDLSTQQRRILRTYTRAGFCSKAAGVLLYDLCMEMLGEDAETKAPSGFQNDNIKLHGANRPPRSTLRLRLQMMDEAISGSRGRRSDLQKPMRFEGGLNN